MFFPLMGRFGLIAGGGAFFPLNFVTALSNVPKPPAGSGAASLVKRFVVAIFCGSETGAARAGPTSRADRRIVKRIVVFSWICGSFELAVMSDAPL